MVMKKTTIAVLLAAGLSLAVLTACGGSTQSVQVQETPASVETPVPTSEPTPEPEYEILGQKVKQSEIDNGYSFELFGQELNTVETESLEYIKTEIGDEGLEQFRQILPYMKNLKSLRFDRCGTTDEAAAALREEFPEANIAWRVYIGPYAIMTDEETLWGSCDVTDETSEGLNYCTGMVNLDLGHCSLDDVSFLKNMPNLKVLILSCGSVEDITPVQYCTNLEYLEIAECMVKDISAVAELKNLEHINIGGNQRITDFSPLYGLKSLKRCFAECIYTTEINMTEVEDKLKEELPGCEVDCGWYADGALNGGRWKYSQGAFRGGFVERYQQLRDTFNYDGGDAVKPYARYLD